MEKRTARLIALIAAVAVVSVAVIITLRQRTEKPAQVITATSTQVSPRRVHSVWATEDGAIAFNYNDQVLEQFTGGEQETISQVLQGVEEVIWSPDGSRAILRVTNDLTITEEAIRTTPLLKPDSENGAFLTWLWNKADRSVSFVSDKYGFVTWTPDGQRIVYTFFPREGEQEIAVANPDGQGWQTLAKLTDLTAHEILFSDGKTVLFLGGEEEDADAVYRLSNGNVEKIADATDAVADPAGGHLLVWRGDVGEIRAVRVDLATMKETVLRLDQVPSTATWARNGVLIVGGVDKDGGHFWKYSEDGRLVLRTDIGSIETILNLVTNRAGTILHFTSADELYRVDLP